jgi:hypothetical protein
MGAEPSNAICLAKKNWPFRWGLSPGVSPCSEGMRQVPPKGRDGPGPCAEGVWKVEVFPEHQDVCRRKLGLVASVVCSAQRILQAQAAGRLVGIGVPDRRAVGEDGEFGWIQDPPLDLDHLLASR